LLDARPDECGITHAETNENAQMLSMKITGEKSEPGSLGPRGPIKVKKVLFGRRWM
jgi:hypothetical protein